MTTVLHRPKQSRAQRRRADRKRAARRAGSHGWIPLASIISVIVVAAVIAILVTGGSTKMGGRVETASVTVTGPALPGPATPDPAVGMRAPVVHGTSFDGGSVSIPVAGQRTIEVFIAHWCPHCRSDIPQVQAWIDMNPLPAGMSLVAVSTWVDESRPNYPPSAWLRKVGWNSPVLVDDAKASAASAYGLQGTPLWVFIGADGIVKFRIEGELTGPQLGRAIERLRSA